jgi:hypothetical protein
MLSICFILFLLSSVLNSNYGQVTCASGWSQYGGSCYLFNPAFNSDGNSYGSQWSTWDQCNSYCPSSYPGATMLCVKNAAENEWTKSQYVTYGLIGYGTYGWIGYTDMPPYGGGKGTKQYGCVSTRCTSQVP